MPFVEQEVATSLNEAHANLAQWTTAVWGHPIQLVDTRAAWKAMAMDSPV